MILQEALKIIRLHYGNQLEKILIKRVVAGVRFTAIELSNGQMGMAFSPITDISNFVSRERNKNTAFTPGYIAGQNVKSLLDYSGENILIPVIKLAAINALSSEILVSSKNKILKKTDPIQLIDFTKSNEICIVGAFHSYIEKIASQNKRLTILELNKNAIHPDYVKYFAPANEAKKHIAKADIIIITGATLANNTLDELLLHTKKGQTIIVVGPTCNIVPDPIFKRNVSILGATLFFNSERFFSIIAEGGSGYNLINECAEKICILNPKYNECK